VERRGERRSGRRQPGSAPPRGAAQESQVLQLRAAVCDLAGPRAPVEGVQERDPGAGAPEEATAHAEVQASGAGQVRVGGDHPRVRAHQVPVRPGEAYDGSRQRRQQRVDRDEQLGVGQGRSAGDDEVARATGEAPPRGHRSGRAVRDGHGLGQERRRVAVPRACVRPVVPGDGVGPVRQQATGGPRPAGEVPVLPAVGAEGLVEAPDLVVPPPAAGQDRADDEAVAAGVGVEQVAAGDVRVAQPGGLGQLERRRDLLDGLLRRGAREVGVPAAPHHQGLRERLGERDHALHEGRLGCGVGVEQHEQVAGAGLHAEVARGSRPEAVVALPHQPHAGRDGGRSPGPVVGDDDLVRRTRLAAQGGEGAVELVLLLEVGDHHRHPPAPVGVGREVPPVARHRGAVGRRGHPTVAHHAR
jgi:hypothetical protein